jgi:hypothetical protein
MPWVHQHDGRRLRAGYFVAGKAGRRAIARLHCDGDGLPGDQNLHSPRSAPATDRHPPANGVGNRRVTPRVRKNRTTRRTPREARRP